MGDVMVVAVIWAWRCGSGARYGAHASADRRTDASTTSAARDRADYRPSAGATRPPTARSAGLYGSATAVVANISPAPITLAMVDCFVIRFLPRSYESGAGCLISLRSRSNSTRHATGQTNGTGLQFQSRPRPRVCPTRYR